MSKVVSLRSLPAALTALSVILVAPAARADVSSWLFTGFGPSSIGRSGAGTDVRPMLELNTGIGSSPASAFAVGGVGRVQWHLGGGVDLGLFARLATGSYVRGNWGAAVDLGTYARPWGGGVGSPGAAATLSLGAPYGITLNLEGARGRDDVTTLAAVIGIDFARFTIYRSTGLGWLPNPFPSPPGRSGL